MDVTVQVTAMVERVVKRQAELGVDIVTDGEVGFLDFKLEQIAIERSASKS